ncbi:branched-chain amino acid transport system ATP-binding protein [Hoeflea marina]|uniref:Branched-chain amino acid transport system ATP-binding protein n=1 Tax=Hoeflea marina TaxID=274592 RepID=A0A317PF56_9HYPH|nr:ABC transporter ATP-binding protein [Hoeflea marina]PWV98821.1 branched-chain amino acid transport system ATP-binding protein [Hoeflea marina]
MTYLNVSNVNKSFGGIRALTDCSFSIRPMETTCVVGPNGAGKTSIFNVITGFIPADTGRIEFKGRDITAESRHDRVEAGIARTFQNLRLFETMTLLDNVIVCLGDNGANDPLSAVFRPFHTQAVLRRKREAAMMLLEQVGLAHKAGDQAANISYGQKKLLCIARVLATGAELLLLDEPTSGLAAAALDNMVELIHALKNQQKTLLIVEHNTKIVKRIADEVLFFHRGTLLAKGKPDEIIANEDLGKIYFGSGA